MHVSSDLHAQGSPTAKDLERSAVAADLAKAYARIEQLDAGLPREEFELEALARSQESDPKKLCSWVDTHTRWMPYAGALRGAEGMLLERRGNSLDRALFLAELLRLSGFAPSLAHATLDDAMAQIVIKRGQTALAPVIESKALRSLADSNRGAMKSSLDHSRSAANSPAAAPTLPVSSAIEQQTHWIVSNLRRSGLTIPANPLEPLNFARDHWWVQLDVNGQTLDLDPDALSQPNQRFVVEADSVVAPADLPEELRQVVVAKVIIERWSGGELTETEVASTRVIPSVSEPLSTISLVHSSKDWTDLPEPKDQASALALVKGTQHWQPLLRVNGTTIEGKAFDELGNVVADRAASAGGIGGGLFGGFGGGGGDETPAPASDGVLTAEWLDFHVITPGRPEKIIRREIIDLMGPARREHPPEKKPAFTAVKSLQARMRRMGEIKTSVLNCRPHVIYFDHRLFAWLLAGRDEWLTLACSPKPDLAEAVRLLQTSAKPDHLAQFALLRGALGQAQTFESAPALISDYEFPSVDPGGELVANEMIDVAYNPTVALNGDPSSVIQQGVADTAAEFYSLSPADEPSRNLFAMLFAHVPGETEAETLAPATTFTGKQSYDVDSLTRLRGQLTNGYAAILPAPNIFKDANHFGWWRVDPESGACIGVLNSGYNGSETEYTVVTSRSNLLIRRIIDLTTHNDSAGIKALLKSNSNSGLLAENLGLGSAESVLVGELMANLMIFARFL